jgi:hypothetical protein
MQEFSPERPRKTRDVNGALDRLEEDVQRLANGIIPTRVS